MRPGLSGNPFYFFWEKIKRLGAEDGNSRPKNLKVYFCRNLNIWLPAFLQF